MEKVITEGVETGMEEEKGGRGEGEGGRMGRVVKWNRKARVNYVHCRTGEGNLQAWRHRLDDDNPEECRKCGRLG